MEQQLMTSRNVFARLSRSLLLSGIVAMALAPVAQAADEARLQKLFELMDKDGDGKVTRPEFQTGLGLVFYTLDANSDLVLTKDELNVSPEGFQRIAGDDDRVEGLEFFTSDVSSFEAIDADTDHIVTFPELLSYIEKYSM
jgi:Ca2+-binding EF-hand superfamily protein